MDCVEKAHHLLVINLRSQLFDKGFQISLHSRGERPCKADQAVGLRSRAAISNGYHYNDTFNKLRILKNVIESFYSFVVRKKFCNIFFERDSGSPKRA